MIPDDLPVDIFGSENTLSLPANARLAAVVAAVPGQWGEEVIDD
jgi:hypothetical protein